MNVIHPISIPNPLQLCWIGNSVCADLGSEVRHGYDMATSRNMPNKIARSEG